MIIYKAKHGKRRYRYGGGSIIDALKSIATSPFAQKLALAAVTGATKGLVQSQLKRDQPPKRPADPLPPKRPALSDKVINGKGMVFE